MGIERTFEHSGLPCVIRWNDPPNVSSRIFEIHGYRCGYVGVPESHPLHGIEYHQSTPVLSEAWAAAKDEPRGSRGIISLMMAAMGDDEENCQPQMVFDVHGSLTFSGAMTHDGAQQYWWFGFDCNHLDDDPDIQTAEYVERECRRLAEQLAAVIPLDTPAPTAVE